MDHGSARAARAPAVQQLLVNDKTGGAELAFLWRRSRSQRCCLWAGNWSRRAICERCRARFAPNSSGPTPAPPARRGGEIAQEEGVWSWFLLCWRVLATRTAHGRDGFAILFRHSCNTRESRVRGRPRTGRPSHPSRTCRQPPDVANQLSNCGVQCQAERRSWRPTPLRRRASIRGGAEALVEPSENEGVRCRSPSERRVPAQHAARHLC